MPSFFKGKVARKVIPVALATFMFIGVGMTSFAKKANAFGSLHERIELDQRERDLKAREERLAAKERRQRDKEWEAAREKEDARRDALPAVVRSDASADKISLWDSDTTILHVKADQKGEMILPLFDGLHRDGEKLGFKGKVALPAGLSSKGALVILDKGEVGNKYVLPTVAARRGYKENKTANQSGKVVFADGSCYHLSVHQNVDEKPVIELEPEEHLSLKGLIKDLDGKKGKDPVMKKVLAEMQARQQNLKGQTPPPPPVFFRGAVYNPNKIPRHDF